MAVQLASAYMQIIPSMQGFQGTIARQLSGEGASAGQAVGSRFSGGFKSVVGAGVIAGAVGGLAGAAAGAVGGALSRGFAGAKDAIIGFNSTLQQSSIGFTTMLGSATKAQSFVQNLQSFAAKTPFEFQGLVQNSNTMLGMGIAAKDVIPDLTALGDSVASVGGDGTVLNNTISAFSQTMAKGTLDMGNMNQLLQGGVPNALKILASSYHVTTGEMVKMISAGKVQSADALPRLIKGIEAGTSSTAALGGMMDKQSVTMQGALSNISDASTQLLAKAFKPLFDQASLGANGLAKILGSPQMTVWAGKIAAGTTAAIGAFNRFKTAAVTALSGLFSGGAGVQVTGFFSQIGAALAPLIPALIQAATAFSPIRIAFQALAPVLPAVTLALTQLSSALGQALLGTVSALAPVIVGLVNGLVSFVVPLLRIAPLVQGVVLGLIAWRSISIATAVATNAVAIATGVIGTVTKVAAAGQWLLNAAMSANPIGIVVVAIAALVAGLIWFFTQTTLGRQIWASFAAFLTQTWTNIVNVATTVWSAVAGAVGAAINAVRTVILTVVGAIVAGWNAYWAQIGAVVRTVFGVVSGIVSGVMSVLRVIVLVALGLIIMGWRAVWGLFGPIVRGALSAIIGFVAPIINGIRTVILTVVGALVGAWNRYWQALANGVRIIWAAIVSVVTTYINRVRSTVTSVVSAIAAVWNAAWNRILAVFRPIWNAIASVVTTVIGRIRAVIAAGVAAVAAVWSAAWNRILGVLRTAWNAIVSAVSGAVGRVVGVVRDMGGKIIGAVAGLASRMFNAGKSIISGFIGGIRSMFGSIGKVASDAMGVAAKFFPHSPAKEGPFSGKGWTLYSGHAISEGLAEGMTARTGLVRSAATGLVSAAHPTLGSYRTPAVAMAPTAGLAVAGSGFPGTVTLVDRNGSLLGHMDARIDRYDMSQQLAGAR